MPIPNAPLSRVEAMARREADASGLPHVVLNLNRAGVPLYVCRELTDRTEADRIVSRFDPAPAPVQAAPAPATSVIGPAYHPLTVRALRTYQDCAKARLQRIPDADADEDYSSGADFAAAEGTIEPVAAIRRYTRTRCGELLVKCRAIRAQLRRGGWQGEDGPMALAVAQESLWQRREDRRALVAAKARAAAVAAPAARMQPTPCQQQQAQANDELPPGFSLWADQDGDWWLAPPSDVTIFSVPGESLLIGTCTRAEAVETARIELSSLDPAA